jgi:DNA invertase Pin-like site-specific DNA recombinase
MARRARATLVVSRLDRLSRNEVKALTLTQSYDIRFADVDTKDPLTVGVLALLAAKERRDIAARTKAALRVLVARGVKLGSARPGHWEGREERRLAGARIGNRAAAEKAAHCPLTPTPRPASSPTNSDGPSPRRRSTSSPGPWKTPGS